MSADRTAYEQGYYDGAIGRGKYPRFEYTDEEIQEYLTGYYHAEKDNSDE